MMAETFKLVSGGEDIKLWEPPNLRLIQTFKPHSQGTSSLAWSPNNNFLASTAPGDAVVVTSFRGSGQNSIELTDCEDDICLTFNSSSRHLLTGGNKSNVLNLWDLKTRTVKKKVKIPKDPVSCVAFNWNDTNIASGTTGGDIYLHSVSTTQTSAPLRLPKTQAIHSIQYSKFKKSLLGAVSDDGAMNVWDTNAKKVVTSFPDQHGAPAMDIGFSPMNDMLLASTGLDKKIVFYDIVGKKVIKEMSAESPLCSISFMHDGASFAVGSTRGKIYIYDLRSGSTPLHSTLAHKSAVRCLAFQLPSPKGSSNSSSSTLAEKFTNRSSSDSSKPPTASSVPHNGGITSTTSTTNTTSTTQDHTVGPASFLKRPAPPEPAQNGLKSKDESGIFSPLRDGSTGTTYTSVGKESKPSDVSAIGPNRTEDVQVSSIFSPVNNASSSITRLSGNTTQPAERVLPTSTTTPTTPSDQSGYQAAPASKDKLPQVTRKPLGLTSSTPSARTFFPTSATGANDVGGRLEPSKSETRLEQGNPPRISSKTGDKRVSVKSTRSQMPVVKDERNSSDIKKEDTADEMTTNASLTKSSPNLKNSDEVPNGSLQLSQTNMTETASGFQQFQVQFMKNLIDDSLDDFKLNFHRDIVNLQVEMLRQFQIQQNEMKTLIQQYSLNNSLVEENERLREEIKRLKATH